MKLINNNNIKQKHKKQHNSSKPINKRHKLTVKRKSPTRHLSRHVTQTRTFSTQQQQQQQYSEIIRGPKLELPQVSLVERVIQHATADPGRNYFRQNNNIYTYGDLLTHSKTISKQFQTIFKNKQELSPKDKKVCILAPSSFEYSSYNLATWMSGAASVPLYVEHPVEEMLHYLTDSRSQILAVHPKNITQAQSLLSLFKKTQAQHKANGDGDDVFPQHDIELVILDEYQAKKSNSFAAFVANGKKDISNNNNLDIPIDPLVHNDIILPSLDDIMVYIYTSGTTSKPKGVCLSHRNIVTNITGMIQEWEWTSDDHILDMLPKHHIHGVVNVLYTATYSGARITSIDETKFHPKKIWMKYLLSGVDYNRPLKLTQDDILNETQHYDVIKEKIPILKNKDNYFPHRLPKQQQGGDDNNNIIFPTIKSEALSLFMAVPTIYSKLIQSYENDFCLEDQIKLSYAASQFRVMVSGSMALPITTMDKWETITGHRLLERYGMSEIGMAITNKLNNQRHPGSIGWPFPGIECRVILNQNDEYDNSTTTTTEKNETNETEEIKVKQENTNTNDNNNNNLIGELLIHGDNVFNYYYNRPEQTKESFITINDNDGRGDLKWFLTGDIAKIERSSSPTENNKDNKHNCISLLGRNSVDILKVSGFKISALDIERTLLDHPLISTLAVVGLPSETTGQSIAAIIVPKKIQKEENESDTTTNDNNNTITIDNLVEWAKDKMPKYKIPREIYITDSIPTNAMGKINKKNLVKFLMEKEEFKNSKWRL